MCAELEGYGHGPVWWEGPWEATVSPTVPLKWAWSQPGRQWRAARQRGHVKAGVGAAAKGVKALWRLLLSGR